MQHEFGNDWVFSLTYLGNETSHLMVGNEFNPAVYIPGQLADNAKCSTTGNTQARRFLNQI